MSTDFTKESRTTSITRPSSIKLPPLPAVNYPFHHHQVRMRIIMCVCVCVCIRFFFVVHTKFLYEIISMTSHLTIENETK